MMVGTMRIVTVCYRLVRLVARRALPRHVPVARHFKLVVPGVRADDLASPGDEVRDNCMFIKTNNTFSWKILDLAGFGIYCYGDSWFTAS